MSSQLNITTLLSGFIIAIAVGVTILISYVVPMWNKKPKPPEPTTHDCRRDLDCDQNLTCINNKCTKVSKPQPFPWKSVGIIIGLTSLAIFLLSAGTVAQTPDNLKQQVSKSLLIRAFLMILGLTLISMIGYFLYKTKFIRQCPEKPRDECPTGMINICNDNTNFNWKCVQQGNPCGNDPTPCKTGEAQCNPSTLKWECPKAECSKTPPKGFVCDKEKDGVLYNARCDSGTQFRWICQPKCDPNGQAPTCATGEHPGCNIDTDHKWDCVPNSSDVCGTTIKPTSCSGPICIDTEKGWTWKCPGDLTRADVIRIKDLVCHDYPNEDDPDKSVNLCFTDSTHNIPIFPTVGHDCTDENSTQSIGKDLDDVIANPTGNITKDNKTFQPYNKNKRIYYQPDSDRLTQCVLSDNLNYTCKNKGIFQQHKPDIGKTGTCDCVSPWKGPICQYSDKTTCNGNGLVDDNGKCVCHNGWKGPNCQYSDKTTCHQQGVVDDNGVCKCNTNWMNILERGGKSTLQCATTKNGQCYGLTAYGEGVEEDCQPITCSDKWPRAGAPPEDTGYKFRSSDDCNYFSRYCLEAGGC